MTTKDCFPSLAIALWKPRRGLFADSPVILSLLYVIRGITEERRGEERRGEERRGEERRGEERRGEERRGEERRGEERRGEERRGEERRGEERRGEERRGEERRGEERRGEERRGDHLNMLLNFLLFFVTGALPFISSSSTKVPSVASDAVLPEAIPPDFNVFSRESVTFAKEPCV